MKEKDPEIQDKIRELWWIIRDKENELYEIDKSNEMRGSKTSSFTTVTKEEETYNQLKRQLDNLNESINFEETSVSEEVKNRE